MQGKYGRLLRRGVCSCLGLVCRGVVNFHAVKEEQPLTEAVVATGELLIAVEAQPLASAFGHLLGSQTALVALGVALVCSRRRCWKGQERWWRWQGRPGRRRRQAARGRPGWSRRRTLQLHQLDLASQADGGGERVRVVESDGAAERWPEPTSEELHPLRFIEAAGARQEGLEPVSVLLHGSCASALSELKHRG